MNKDLNKLLAGWPYDPNEVRARWIRAEDGTRKVQLRLDLGVFQMEINGRPDGTQPYGFSSLLDYYIEEEMRAPGHVLPYKLDVNACAELQQEVMQYYYRIMAFYALGDFEGVVVDCDHNLDLIDMVSEYAQDDEIAWQFMQLYPYLRMMLARARAEQYLGKEDYDKAEEAVRAGIRDLEGFFAENYEPANADGAPAPPPPELVALRELRIQIDRKRPRTPAETLRQELMRAVELEDYEKAALLRDQLKTLQGLNAPRAGKKRLRPGERGNTP